MALRYSFTNNRKGNIMINLQDLWRRSTEQNVLQKEEEWMPFIDEVLKLPQRKNCLEIGVNSGGTILFFHELFDYVYGIDIEQHSQLGKVLPSMPRYSHIIADSHLKDTVKISEALGVKFDLLFIDGDHFYEGVKKDFENYKHLVAEGGMIAFHDIVVSDFHHSYNCWVGEFWNEIKDQYDYQEMITTSPLTSYHPGHDWVNNSDARLWGGIGIIRV